MVSATSPSKNGMVIILRSRLAPTFVLLYLCLALVVFLLAPIFYLRAIRTPFPGAFIGHTLMINTAQPSHSGAWGEQLRLPFGYQVVAVDGVRLQDPQELYSLLQQHQIGDEISLTLRHLDGQERLVAVRLMALPMLDRLSYFLVPYLTGLIYLLSGLYVFGVRRFDPAGRAFAAFAVSTAVVLAGLFDLYTTNALTLAWTFSLAMVGGALINLAILFPVSLPIAERRPYLGWVGYGIAFLIGLAAWPTLYNIERPLAYLSIWRLDFIFVALATLFFMILTAVRWIGAISAVAREQARLIFWGAMFSLFPLALWFVITIIYPSVAFTPLYSLPLGLFPVFAGYAIIRYRNLRIDYILSQTVLYAILTGISLAAYALLLSGVSFILGSAVQPANPYIIGIMVFLLAVGLNPARNRLQEAIDRYFFRSQAAYRDLQQAFGQELTQIMDLPAIVALLRRYIDQALAPTFLHIFIYDPFSGQYAAAKDERNLPTNDLRFSPNSALVQTLSKSREALFVADGEELPPALQPEQARVRLLAANLYLPLPGRNRLTGWLALGTRRSGEPYTYRDLDFLEGLSNQVALAIERTQVVADLERRVREMNVLTRVAQGISFTVTFDDILELISAQTNQILPARDFRITLVDKDSGVMYHAFYLEDDERLNERENRPLNPGQGLEMEVINGQRSIIANDYEQECRQRGLIPDATGIYAWMGVPLNAGADTIGAISIASRDPTVVYTEEQRNLLQAIADQASGAIVKARSLEESERRALQLAKLNEIGLGLTSTLDLKPLLNQVLASATEILNCEAGSLFLVDPQTDELVFEVVLGPVAANLLGRRLPPGTGLVGQAVLTGKPIIANDAKRRKEWFEKTDAQTGFDTQDMLVVPMRIQDRVIGVIEVINKVNGAPFTQADQELLTAFTSQATIALENARLYTLTDQALAERVEELSVMQRIDRELNASLDIQRAMRLTLDWALRQSRADAGFVGAVDGSNVRVMVFQGYPDELFDQSDAPEEERLILPVQLPLWKEAIEKGQLAYHLEDGQPSGFLNGSRQQIVIPIRRETATIGVLVLESLRAEKLPDERLSFLTRLSDHAAIAIANAQLYEEVKEANLAKSRFVSFVAHELKNPMASIKGYTELVASGMAGPVNEVQAGFLSTVRSNVDRMNTIVSDLNDLTKIQVGNLRLDFRAVSISEVLEDVARSIQRQIEEKGQKLTILLSNDLPPVWADASRLAQILTNLISNAQKYTPEGGSITVYAEQMVADAENLAGATFAHIWVEDNGIGIAEEDQKKIFQQYFRTDGAKEMASGTGLGLAITKSLVELQGGRIWFESVLGQGTTFHFTLPAAEAQ